MTQQVELEINKEAHNMMEALGITSDRCKELCGLIENLVADDNNINLGQVLERAAEHCQTQNELTFLSYVLGTHIGETTANMKQSMGNMLHSLFESLERRHNGHDFRYRQDQHN